MQIIHVRNFFFLTLTFITGSATGVGLHAQGLMEISTYCGHKDFLQGTL